MGLPSKTDHSVQLHLSHTCTSNPIKLYKEKKGEGQNQLTKSLEWDANYQNN